MKRKVLAILLALCVALTMMPTVALAGESGENVVDLTKEKLESYKQSSLGSFIYQLPSGNYKLVNDIEIEYQLQIGQIVSESGPTAVTLDLNGYTLSGNVGLSTVIMINFESSLTVKDSSGEAKGKIVGKKDQSYAIYITPGSVTKRASLTLEQGTIEAGTAVKASSPFTAVTINGGHLIRKSNQGYAIQGSPAANQLVLSINSGIIDGSVECNELNANDGIINGNVRCNQLEIDTGSSGAVINGFVDAYTISGFNEVQFISDSSKVKVVKSGENVTAPADPTKDGYNFKGWYEKDGNTFKQEAFDFDRTISNNISLYANWESKGYTVVFDVNGGDTMSTASVNYDNKLSVLGTPTRAGYEFTAWKYGDNTQILASALETTTYADLAKSDTVKTITLTAQWKDNQPPTFDGLKDNETYRGDVTFTVSDGNGSGVKSVSVQNGGKDETLTADIDGNYILKSGSGKVTVTVTDNEGNSNTITVTINSRSSGTTVQKPSVSLGTDAKTEKAADGSTIYTTAEGSIVLSRDGRTAAITPADGYEVANVSVNGKDMGAITTLTGLKTGDEIIVSFKLTAEAQAKAEVTQIKALAEKMSLTARSTKTAKKNIKVTLKTDEETTAAVKEIQNLGYTVKYKFYRSSKKSSAYKAMLTKSGKSYTNTNGKAGTKYYYKAQVRVYDENGKCVAKTALKQCKYASRTWSK